KVITNTPFSVKTRLEIEMPLPGEKKIIEGIAEVRWVKSRPEGDIYEMGLEFVELDQQNKIHLLEHVYRKIISS
ncbi:MAG: PilZ domain-containing protein, partial [Candidatus Aminicenantes bacterium]|nr:PilZ domain-containing protein [Candidatus Aminicenantes bacterium]